MPGLTDLYGHRGYTATRKVMPVPKTLNWDLFIGSAPIRPYNEIYTPWNWRGWWDFGTGAFGDMACHVMDPIYRSLKLGYPDKVRGSSTSINTDSAPQAETVEFSFPARDNMPKLALPPVKVHWYDGGLLPNLSDLLPEGENLMADGLGGCLFIGSKGFPYVRFRRLQSTPDVRTGSKCKAISEKDSGRSCFLS
jgi:hypothetical protein